MLFKTKELQKSSFRFFGFLFVVKFITFFNSYFNLDFGVMPSITSLCHSLIIKRV